MRLQDLLVPALLLAAPWALAPTTAATSHDPVLVDPAGDAYDATPQAAADHAWSLCEMALNLPRDACDNATAPAYAAPSAGPPAPPGRDIVALRLSETPMDLVVEIDVARLDTGLADALPRDGTSAWWATCWNNSTECVGGIASRIGGRIGLTGFLMRWSERDCGDRSYCLWHVPMTLAAGTPGTLRFDVPRALLAEADAGARLEDALVTVSASEDSFTMSDWGVATPVRSTGGHVMFGAGLVDMASGGRTFTFRTPSLSTWDGLTSGLRADEDGDVHNRDGIPDADVRTIAVRENETTITFSAEMARVNETAPQMMSVFEFSLSSGPSLRVNVNDRREERRTEISVCGDRTCSYRVQAPGVVEVVEGEPGWINVTLDRADLGYPAAGTRVVGLYALVWMYDARELEPSPAVSARHEGEVVAEYLAFGPYYALQLDGVRPPAEAAGGATGVVVRDLARDVNDDRPQVDPAAGQYDLVLVALEGTSTTSTRVTLGVRDLSRISVPSGSKAIVYSAALSTERGDFLVGFYRDASRGEFFCATDTLVLTDDKRDPAEAAWSIIEGVLTVGGMATGGAPGGSASSPSTLTLFVPHACFGTDTPGQIAGDQVVGAIHLIPQSPAAGVPLEEIWLADEARDDSVAGFALGAPLPAEAARAWYAAPFGIDGFWDISGIVLAVAVSVAGFFAVRRRRSLLQRYLDQVDRAVHAHAEDTKAREIALVDIRRRLRQDLLSGRLVESHYLLVDHRLNEHLTQVRMRALSEAFGELPHRLLQKLLEILQDGTITREEARRFGALLEDSGLTEEAKSRIRRKLDLWVVEDSAATA